MKRHTVWQGVSPLLLLFVWIGATPVSSAEETITVWVDDAHSQQVTVAKLDPDEIADASSFSLSLGIGFSNFGISLGWEKKKGIEYNEKVQALIQKLRDLCEAFNDGELSLESYRRRIRDIYAAEEKARLFRIEMLMRISQDSYQAFVEMDKIFGMPPQDLEEFKGGIEKALSFFQDSAKAVYAESALTPPPPAPPSATGESLTEDARSNWQRMQADTKQAMDARLSEFGQLIDRAPRNHRSDEMITIWKDYDKTQRITVPKLDTEHLVNDVDKSVSLGNRYSGFFCSFDVGPRTTWVLNRATDYNQASQLLILKYKQLCLEYNSCLLCQEEYADRLQGLFEAEEKARNARYQMGLLLKEQTDVALADMDSRLAETTGMTPMPGESDLEKITQEMKGSWNEVRKSKAPPSLVGQMSREHREKMVSTDLDEFGRCLTQVPLQTEGDTIRVWVDDDQTQQVTVPRLDPDLFAQNTESRLTLHITYFNFGPEIAWAKKKGLAYRQASQILIIRYKQLCMDYNAGLVSQESFQRLRRQIDSAIERASKVREKMTLLIHELKKSSFKEMDRQFDLLKNQFNND